MVGKVHFPTADMAILTVSNGDGFVVVREGVKDAFAVYAMDIGAERVWFGYAPRVEPQEEPTAYKVAGLWFMHAYPGWSELDG